MVSCEFSEIGFTSKYKKQKWTQMFLKKMYARFVYIWLNLAVIENKAHLL